VKAIVRARKRKNVKPYMIPEEVGKMLGVSAQMVRVSLRQGAPGWDFPFVLAGSYIRIPRAAFMEWYRGRRA
jgi:hypothetical protein